MRVDANGTGIEVETMGDGPPVVLLHGFPDSGRLWRNQRGYGRSDKPEDVAAYAMPFLVGDVIAVLDALGIQTARVVGHDWGAAVAWAIASFVPDRVERLAVLSVGHPASFRTAGYAQREKSWYMLLFQFEGVAERWLSDHDWHNFR